MMAGSLKLLSRRSNEGKGIAVLSNDELILMFTQPTSFEPSVKIFCQTKKSVSGFR
jgi:hypothetical protein